MLDIGHPYVDALVILVVVVILAGALHILVVGEAHLLLLPLYVAVVRNRLVLVDGLDAQLLLVVVLLEVALQPPRQLQLIDAVVAGIGDNSGARQLLQREGLAPVEGNGEAGLEEHDAGGVLVVLQQTRHRWSREHGRIVAVEAVRRKSRLLVWVSFFVYFILEAFLVRFQSLMKSLKKMYPKVCYKKLWNKMSLTLGRKTINCIL